MKKLKSKIALYGVLYGMISVFSLSGCSSQEEPKLNNYYVTEEDYNFSDEELLDIQTEIEQSNSKIPTTINNLETPKCLIVQDPIYNQDRIYFMKKEDEMSITSTDVFSVNQFWDDAVAAVHGYLDRETILNSYINLELSKYVSDNGENYVEQKYHIVYKEDDITKTVVVIDEYFSDKNLGIAIMNKTLVDTNTNQKMYAWSFIEGDKSIANQAESSLFSTIEDEELKNIIMEYFNTDKEGCVLEKKF